MDSKKLDMQDFVWSFTPDEVVTILDFLQHLSQLWTPEVEGLLSHFSKGIIPLSGISAAKRYFYEIKNLDLPIDKKGHVYRALNAVSASDLLRELSDYLETQKKEELVASETISSSEPEIDHDGWTDQVKSASYIPRTREKTAHIPATYYQIDDEEYMVKSRYVHPSPFGVEEGYPPFIRKKKKVQAEY